MTLKRLAYQLLLLSLTLGASLIIGLLSFGGLYALWPNLIIASFAFVLSVAYEGEIYLQNLKGALQSLFNRNAMPLELAKIILRDYFPHHIPHENRPDFFLEYESTLHQLHAFEHQALTPSRRRKKQDIESRLEALEKKFLTYLTCSDETQLTEEERQMVLFLRKYPLRTNANQSSISLQTHFENEQKRRLPFESKIRAFGIFTAIAMSIGTSYLLVETFAVIPLLATLAIPLPILIVPMSIVSGIAYGLLTYNTLKNVVLHERIQARIEKLKADYKQNGLTWRNTATIGTSVVLGGLAVMLTICTAGTWFTIIQQTPALFRSVRTVFSKILAVVIPIITSIAALAFNLENSTESLNMIDEALDDSKYWKRDWEDFKYLIQKQWNQEHLLQRINPFRLILIATLTPLRFVLFLGHLISIGVTSDRVPGLSQTLSALLGIVSELFEDGHYFIKSKRHYHNTESLLKERLGGEDHHHDDDLPSRLLNFVFSPIQFLSTLWDYMGSQLNADKKLQKSFHDLFKAKEILPEIPLPFTLKTDRKTNQMPENSTSKMNGYLEKNKTQSVEDSILSECPCCPSPYLYRGKVDKKMNKKDSSAFKSESVEKKSTRKMGVKTSKIQKTKEQKPVEINLEFCTFITPPRKKPVKSTRLTKASSLQDETQPNVETQIHPA